MLRLKVLPKILEQANGNEVVSTINSSLLNMEGSTIAYAGSNAKLDVISAIVSNIWDSYNSESTKLDVLLLDCEQNKLVITKVSELLLCIVSTEKGEFGVLKAKILSLKQYLEKPLSEVL